MIKPRVLLTVTLLALLFAGGVSVQCTQAASQADGPLTRNIPSGREGDWFLSGFSSRKQNLTLYLSGGFEQQAPLMQKLGKHKVGRGCLYINNLEDIHLPTLKTLIAKSVKQAVTHNRAALAASKTAKQKKG
jgi:hypothetical protein